MSSGEATLAILLAAAPFFAGSWVDDAVDIAGDAARHGDEVVGAAASCLINSFEAGTMVETIDGPVPIEEIDVGTYVLGYDEETGEIGYYPVTHLISHLDFKVVYLTIDGEVIVTTAEHPFYTAEGEWVDAIDLRVGDEIRTAEWTTGVVSSVYEVTRPQPMYNFTVDIAHTYFIGNNQWLVHNCKISMEEALDRASEFFDPNIDIRTVESSTGVQFIQEFIDADGNRITRRVGFDIDPNSGHVIANGPHLNIQTQINGRIVRDGLLADPHTPIDPDTIIPGDY